MQKKDTRPRIPRNRKEFDAYLEAEKFASLAEFAAGAGHDLNNPLAAIMGRAQLLLRQENDPGKRADLALICANVHRAQEMIGDLRLVAQAPTPELRTVNLSNLFTTLHTRFADEFLQLEITYNVMYEKDVPTDIFADPTQMQVLFRALIQNAIRAITRNGAIHITVGGQDGGGTLALRISDTGHGVADGIRGMIFDPFFSSYQSGRGLGFGLTKARRIAHMHGGEVILENSHAPTTFLVTLPLRDSSDET